MAPAGDAPGGSNVAMIRLATSFYSDVLKSPLLSPYFAGVSMDALIAKQAAFIDTIIRGDPGYSADDLRRAHAHLKIADEAFDELLTILDTTLRDHGIQAEARSWIHHSFASFRQVIVTRVAK